MYSVEATHSSVCAKYRLRKLEFAAAAKCVYLLHSVASFDATAAPLVERKTYRLFQAWISILRFCPSKAELPCFLRWYCKLATFPTVQMATRRACYGRGYMLQCFWLTWIYSCVYPEYVPGELQQRFW